MSRWTPEQIARIFDLPARLVATMTETTHIDWRTAEQLTGRRLDRRRAYFRRGDAVLRFARVEDVSEAADLNKLIEVEPA